MDFIVWRDGPPPEGYELGQAPEDFGIGRSAYKWREAKPGEKSTFSDGRMLVDFVTRGGRYIRRADGTLLNINSSFSGEALVELLREAARDGIKGDL